MKPPDKRPNEQPPAKIRNVVLPPGMEKLTARQIETAKEYRRKGLSLRQVEAAMGISQASVYRHTKGIKAEVSNDGKPSEEASVSEVVSHPNGGEAPVLSESKSKKFMVEVELDPQLVLLLAGDAARLGYPTVTKYIQEYNVPWLAALAEGAEMLNVKEPSEFKEKLTEIVKGYVAFKRMMTESQKEAEKNVVKSDGQQSRGS